MDKKDQLNQLLDEIRSGAKPRIREAVEKLRENGWLEDGSLRGVNLEEVDLAKLDLSRANLMFAELSGCDLRGVNLSEAKLSHASLQNTQLQRANFSKADLYGVDFINADLGGANLTGANLEKANLEDTDLQYSNLINADLTGANLSNAFLANADLSNAILSMAKLSGNDFYETKFLNVTCGYTVFANVDFSNVEGLETVQHIAPSSIATDTILRSGDKIPEIFLRGCGLPESLITSLRASLGKTTDFYSCFISYSHANKSFARRLHDTLQGQGIRCWLDEKEMSPGEKIHTAVYEGIRYWDKVLLCCSETSLKSWWVDNELNLALEKERELSKERGRDVLAIIPLDLDGYLFSKDFQHGWAGQIRQRLAADFKGWEHDNAKFEQGMEGVMRALRAGAKPDRPKPKL